MFLSQSTQPWRKAFEQFAGAVFVGQVVRTEKIKVQRSSGREVMRKVTVKVEQQWVGVSGSQIVVYAGLGGCDKRHFKGQKYFFFAQSQEHRLEVAGCFLSSLDNEVINSFRRWFAEPEPTLFD